MNYLVAHLIGDYIFQTDRMAIEKKSSTLTCLVHCIIWAGTIQIITQWPLWTVPILILQHFLQDRWQFVRWLMHKMEARNFNSDKFFIPWSVILWDNILHLTFLYFVDKIVGKM